MDNIGNQRLARFMAACTMIALSKTHELNGRLIKDMVAPILEDVAEVAERYGRMGAPCVAAAMEMVAASMVQSLDKTGLDVYRKHKEHIQVGTVVMPKRKTEQEAGGGNSVNKARYYIKALRWLWANRTWRSSRQKWKAFDRAIEGES